jgi:predicted permease
MPLFRCPSNSLPLHIIFEIENVPMNDLKFAFRQLLKNPGFTTVAVLTLALGIGVNTSMFSALQTLLSRRLSYPEPRSLVQLFQESRRSQPEPQHSAPNILDYQRSGTFEYVAGFTGKSFNLSEPGESPERVEGTQVLTDFFPLLGVQPLLGRWFNPEEQVPGKDAVVILEHGFWQRRFSGDPKIVGRVIRVDGEPSTVIGVMPEQFRDMMLNGPCSLWKPLASTEGGRGYSYLKCIARLKPGQSVAQAQAAADVLVTRQLEQHPDGSPDGLKLVPLAESSLPRQARLIVWLVMGLAMFVLLIACANLANLQFARTAARGRELAIRGAMGATRGVLIRQLLMESLTLSLIGGVLGLILAQWCNGVLSRQFLTEGRPILEFGLDSRALVFSMLASAGSGIAFGLVPAWLGSRKSASEALKQGARGATGDRLQNRLQHSLIIAEVALAMMLLGGAGIMLNGLRAFAMINPGWRSEGMTLGYLTLPEAKYPDGSTLRNFADRSLEKLRALPGVEDAAICWNLPIRQFNVTSGFGVDGWQELPKGVKQTCSVNGITPGYFKVLGMPILAGRNFTEADLTNRPAVTIINQRMARALWPEGSPLGQRINGAEIVGVVGDVSFPANPSEMRTAFQTYRPFAQEPRRFLNVALRGRVSGDLLRKTILEVDPDQPVGEAGAAELDIRKSLANWGVGGNLLATFAALGLALAALGIYGVISGFVVRRTAEIGVRMALGARMGDVLWMVIGKGLRLSLIGACAGLCGAFGLVRISRAILPEMPADNPLVMLLVAAVLIGATLFACWLPARRASRVDPMVALRAD